MRHIVLGDLHGCGSEFESLLEAIDRVHEPRSTHLVLIGDLLAKGPRPDLVVQSILTRRRDHGRVTLLCGNHELRFLGAIGRLSSGTAHKQLQRSERETIELLKEADLLAAATDLMLEASRRISLTVTDPTRRWTAVHAGIEPSLGLEATPDHLKIHIKARKGEKDWWERYDGSDGLIIFGHKPVPEPVVCRDCVGRPIAVNLDTGCIYGGHLSAYDVEADELLQVRSQQPIDKQNLEFAVSPTVAPSELRGAWDDPSQTSAG